MAEINITPFTDVLLVLLIIFMILAALAAPPGFQKQLPKTSAPQIIPPKVLQHQIEVDVTANNFIYIDRNPKPIPIRDLYSAVANAVAFHRSHAKQLYTTHVSLVADKNASYNTIIKILDAARAAGDDDVGFVTQ